MQHKHKILSEADWYVSFPLDCDVEELKVWAKEKMKLSKGCLLYTSPSPRDVRSSRMQSSA